MLRLGRAIFLNIFVDIPPPRKSPDSQTLHWLHWFAMVCIGRIGWHWLYWFALACIGRTGLHWLHRFALVGLAPLVASVALVSLVALVALVPFENISYDSFAI